VPDQVFDRRRMINRQEPATSRAPGVSAKPNRFFLENEVATPARKLSARHAAQLRRAVARD
jgi:hypothetical protein